MRAEGHGVEAGEVIAIYAANDARAMRVKMKRSARRQRRSEERNDAMLELIEESVSVHEGKSEAGDGVFGEEFVDIAADEIGAAKTAGLNGEAFGL